MTCRLTIGWFLGRCTTGHRLPIFSRWGNGYYWRAKTSPNHPPSDFLPSRDSSLFSEAISEKNRTWSIGKLHPLRLRFELVSICSLTLPLTRLLSELRTEADDCLLQVSVGSTDGKGKQLHPEYPRVPRVVAEHLCD